MTTDNRASEHDSTTNPALAVHVSQLVKRYGDMVALDYFDLDVNQGEIFGLLGPNGSGKTTAINCILALLTYDSGTIRVFGQPMTPTSYALKRRIGIVPQAMFRRRSRPPDSLPGRNLRKSWSPTNSMDSSTSGARSVFFGTYSEQK